MLLALLARQLLRGLQGRDPVTPAAESLWYTVVTAEGLCRCTGVEECAGFSADGGMPSREQSAASTPHKYKLRLPSVAGHGGRRNE